MLEYKEDIDTIVSEGQFESSQKRNVMGIVRLFGIVDQAPFRERPLLVGQPLRGRWKVGEYEAIQISF